MSNDGAAATIVEPKPSSTPEIAPQPTSSELLEETRRMIFSGATTAEIRRSIIAALKATAAEHALSATVDILLLYKTTTLVEVDLDCIYGALNRLRPQFRDILLMLHSNGGEIPPAYLISKLCRERTRSNFHVAVPRRAKSAATLICCGADEIHLGSLSELGPIDPQLNGIPALATKAGFEEVVHLASQHPEASEMLATYLARVLPPYFLGYCERSGLSAEHYAERLLSASQQPLPKAAADIAYDLVHEYKDHGFVIDKDEATSLFGSDRVKVGQPPYLMANALYSVLSRCEWWLSWNRNLGLIAVGSLDDVLLFERSTSLDSRKSVGGTTLGTPNSGNGWPT